MGTIQPNKTLNFKQKIDLEKNEMKLLSVICPALLYALPLENGSKAKPKILCLHGGGQTAWGFSHMKGMTDLVEALPEFEFVFASAPDPNHVWIRDPPGGKDEPTTDPGMISILCIGCNVTWL